MNNEKKDKGSQKKYPSVNQYTRREWALLCSRLKYGQIPTNLVHSKTGQVVGSYPFRRQARKHKLAVDRLVKA